MLNTGDVLVENRARWAILSAPYDPELGIGSPLPRKPFPITDKESVFLPEAMFELPDVKTILDNYGSLEGAIEESGFDRDTIIDDFGALRCHHDFEYWALTCAKIKPKDGEGDISGVIPFILSVPQRKVLRELERMRTQGIPIRVIILKARQWGCSTLIQLYIAWLQLFHHPTWNSLIVADKKDKANHVREMYKRVADHHPPMFSDISRIVLKPYGSTQNHRQIAGRDNILGVTSAEEPTSPDAFTFHFLQLTEVGLWGTTEKNNPEELVSSLYASLVNSPGTLCVKESRARGVGTFFHRDWIRAVNGESKDLPIFVAWFEEVTYSQAVPDAKAFIESWDAYEQFLWTSGATVEHIYWYREKKRDYQSHWRMQEQYPTTPQEAFQSSGHRRFAVERVANARRTCLPPIAIGDLTADSAYGPQCFKSIRFTSNERSGYLRIWKFPHKHGMEKPNKIYTNRYCSFADIGGTREKADWSVVTVYDRLMTCFGGVPEVCAELRLHVDQDIFAWQAAQLSWWYGKALLAVEVNKLRHSVDTGEDGAFEGSHSYTILDQIGDYYPNLYYRTKPESVRTHWSGVLGFHMNVATKVMLMDNMDAALRDELYVERVIEACDELDAFENKPDGSMGAAEGHKDDRVVTHSGGYWLHTTMDAVREVDPSTMRSKKRVGNPAYFR